MTRSSGTQSSRPTPSSPTLTSDGAEGAGARGCGVECNLRGVCSLSLDKPPIPGHLPSLRLLRSAPARLSCVTRGVSAESVVRRRPGRPDDSHSH
eukprot:2274705-Prymnesium_polylepis.1